MELTFVNDLGQSFVVEIDPNMELENVMALLEAEVSGEHTPIARCTQGIVPHPAVRHTSKRAEHFARGPRPQQSEGDDERMRGRGSRYASPSEEGLGCRTVGSHPLSIRAAELNALLDTGLWSRMPR